MSDKKEKSKPIKFGVDDYVQISYNDKTYLVRVTKYSDRMCRGTAQKHYPYVEDEIDFEVKDVLSNLGSSPSRLNKLGFEVHHATSKISGIGDIHYFVKIGSTVKDELKTAITKGYKALEKKGLVSFFPLNFEIKPEKGKMAGYYVANFKSDVDTMGFRLINGNDFRHCFFHEAGHGIYERLITSRSLKAKWVALYNEFIEVNEISSKQIKHLYSVFASNEGTMSEFRSSLEEESDSVMLKEILTYIKKYHRLNIKDLDVLAEGEKAEIKKLWPKDGLSLTREKDTGITSYAATAPKELFCESFAFYMTGKKLPKNIKKLMEKTLTKAAQ